ncbi:MAG: ATP-binding protein, partial [Verrucomicrobiota bacterium]|nr:ATP-binding protein [Verrucomicrobiota bacterium]
RHAAAGSIPRQERFASDPEYAGGINALLAAKRIALVEDDELRGVLWFIQQRSLEPLGLKTLAQELFDFLPARVGSPTMRKIGCKPDKIYGAELVRTIRDEIPDSDFPLKGDVIEDWRDNFLILDEDEDDPAPPPRGERILRGPTSYKGESFIACVRKAALDLPELLTAFCLDPSIDLKNSAAPQSHWRTRRDAAGVWFFDDLIDGLKCYRRHCAERAPQTLASTDISDQITAALDFCFRRRRMVLIEGAAGLGKTATVKAWCNRYPGLARRVEIPSSNDDRSFYVAIAEAIGVARGSAYNGQQIKLRVEEALRASGLMLVLDEAQFAWPQKYNRPQGVPVRMQWIKTAFDNGTPFALVGLPEFSDWQALYVKKTLWRDSQFIRRLNRHVSLPPAHSGDDLMKIARAVHPDGDEASWKLLAGCALALPKKQASAISETFISATDIAEEDSRDRVTYEDISAAMENDFQTCESRPAEPRESASAVAMQPRCKDAATGGAVSRNVRLDRPARSASATSFSTTRRANTPAGISAVTT